MLPRDWERMGMHFDGHALGLHQHVVGVAVDVALFGFERRFEVVRERGSVGNAKVRRGVHAGVGEGDGFMLVDGRGSGHCYVLCVVARTGSIAAGRRADARPFPMRADPARNAYHPLTGRWFFL